MPHCRLHFAELLKNINPSEARIEVAVEVPSDLRDWLKEHDFETVAPHTRLIGSYQRHTAILDIKDVDLLVFVPEESLDKTPNSALLELKKVLDGYGDGIVETTGQRRSIRVDFADHDFRLDIVPAVAPDGLDEPLEIPDRPAEEWIRSDPLGYALRLKDCNQAHGEKVKPLTKLFKTWRDVQMKTRKPKSYVLEVLVLRAVEQENIVLQGSSAEQNFADLILYIRDKYEELMDNGKGSPRILDPQLGHCITTNWERSHFETFMRRIRESCSRAERALNAGSLDDAAEEWAKVFGEHWPDEDTVAAAARAEAENIQPGTTRVSSSGNVAAGVGVVSKRTKYYGD